MARELRERHDTQDWSARLTSALQNGIVFGLPLGRVVDVAFAVVVVLSLLLKLRITRGHAVWDWMPSSAVLLEGAFAVALVAGLVLAFPRRRYLALVVGYSISSLLLLVTTMYAGYAGGILAARDLVLANQVPEVWSSVTSLLRAHRVEYAFDLPVVLLLGYLLHRYGSGASVHGRTTIAWGVFMASFIVCAAMVARAFMLPAAVDDIAAARERGLVAWQIAVNVRPANVYAREDVPADPGELQALIDEVTDRQLGERMVDFEPGIGAGSSVIVIQVEALQTFTIGLKAAGVPVTPNLTRLARSSLFFPNTYSQVRKGVTSDAEFVLNTSLYAPYAAAAPVAYSGRRLTALPALLGERGYRTVAFHTNAAGFWNRVRMMPSLGFQEFYDREYFGQDDVIGFGASDEALYAKAIDLIAEFDRSDDPFYAYLISVTSHHPFEPLPKAKKPLQLPAPYGGTLVGRYLSHVEYADRALGEFIDAYERSGLSERCTLVVVGDHFGLAPRELGGADMAALEAALGRPYDLVDAMRVPLFIRLPGQETGTRLDQTVGHVDIMPTLAELLGLDLADVPHFGTSAFVEHTTLMQGCGLVSPGSYLTDSAAVIPGVEHEGSTVIDLSSHRPLGASTVPEDSLDRIRRLSGLSDAYVRSLPVDDEPALGRRAYIPN